MAAQQQRQQQWQQQQQQRPWWEEPLHGFGAALQGVQHNLQQFADGLGQWPGQPRRQQALPPAASITLTANSTPTLSSSSSGRGAAAAAFEPGSSRQQQQHGGKAVTKEEVGHATWVFLHTLAAQFPAQPSRQQQRDARQLIDSLTRIYPCADCSRHFQELVKRDPPDVSSGPRFAAWMCRTHNAVNRRLGKPTFNCDLVAARWAPLDCDEHNSCDMTLGRR